MNELLAQAGLTAWKPLLSALLLPPVPMLALALVGGVLLARQRRGGWPLLLTGLAGVWLFATPAVAEWMQRRWLDVPPALSAREVEALRQKPRGHGVIVVLGGGREAVAPEYGQPNLTPLSMARLRFGLWLGRRTGWPVAFSGGVGHAQPGGVPEAEIAARIAQTEFGQRLAWAEARSRDTRENAERSIALLGRSGVQHVVIVTHAFHMPRALRAFEQAAAADDDGPLQVVPAPMGLGEIDTSPVLRWWPSGEGFQLARQVWRERLGLWMGA